MKEWAKMPSFWIRDKDNFPFPGMKWSGSKKSDQIAALMVYIILVHHAEQATGLCSLTYTKLSDISGLSRAKISGGINILKQLGVIDLIGQGRNNIYKIENFEMHSGWAKLPAQGLYNSNYEKIPAFHKFHLRSKNELNAIKIYLLIVALRNNALNYTKIGYERISEYTGIHRNEIRSALSLLINLRLLQVDTEDSDINQFCNGLIKLN